MALLTAYFDESGLSPDEQYCVVAGFIGNDAQWAAFAADWIPAIKPRQNLHMRKLRWNSQRDRIASLLAKLGPLPHKYNLTPIAVSMKWSDYETHLKGKIPSQYAGHPYITCAQSCIAATLLEVIKDDEIYFVFDRQEGLRKELMDELRDIVFGFIGADRRVKGMDFIDHSETVCLDPADYFAYITRELAVDESSFAARAGVSIIGDRIHGGRIGPHQMDLIVNSWSAKTAEEVYVDLQKSPFFRGPVVTSEFVERTAERLKRRDAKKKRESEPGV